jgi:hypothetical protein
MNTTPDELLRTSSPYGHGLTPSQFAHQFGADPGVVSFGYRSGPRWLMALACCGAAEMLGAFDAGIG